MERPEDVGDPVVSFDLARVDVEPLGQSGDDLAKVGIVVGKLHDAARELRITARIRSRSAGWAYSSASSARRSASRVMPTGVFAE